MPTLDVSKKDLERLVGQKFSRTDLDEILEYVKGELDGVEGDNLKVDCKDTNRPDLWSTEGLARDIKARLGKAKGIKKYNVKKGKICVTVDKNLEKVRPLIACAVVRGVKIDNAFIVQMVQLQEKVGESFGRKRKEVGIGLYDLNVMKPPVYYKGYKDNEIEFVPLEWKVPMRPTEILKQHEKGKAYAHLLEGSKYYPIVIDSADTVASMPPIINSHVTGKVSEKTKSLFIEVTGFTWEIVETALEVMCMALADRGGKIESCKVNFPKTTLPYPAKSKVVPEFNTKKITFDKSLVEKVTGMKFKDSEIKKLLENARYNVLITSKKITCEYPAYRLDILHTVDVIEDLLISYGYNKIAPAKVKMDVVGSQKKDVLYVDLVRDGCVGLGLQEILTFNLASKKVQLENMFITKKDCLVEISNPVSSNYEVLRKKLTPQVLLSLTKNKGQEFPQRIFEVGTCLDIDPNSDNGVKQSNHVCVVSTHSNVNFTEIKSLLVSLTAYIGKEVKTKKKAFPFLGENSAEITVNGKKGFIGELSKEVEQNFGLKKPTCVFEFEL